MAVYVDNAAIKARGKVWFHLMSDFVDPKDEEVHRFAAQIGLKRHWFHGDHYDVTEGKRRAALANGAVSCDVFKIVEIRRLKRSAKGSSKNV